MQNEQITDGQGLRLAAEYCKENGIEESHMDDVCLAFQAGRISALSELLDFLDAEPIGITDEYPEFKDDIIKYFE